MGCCPEARVGGERVGERIRAVRRPWLSGPLLRACGSVRACVVRPPSRLLLGWLPPCLSQLSLASASSWFVPLPPLLLQRNPLLRCALLVLSARCRRLVGCGRPPHRSVNRSSVVCGSASVVWVVRTLAKSQSARVPPKRPAREPEEPENPGCDLAKSGQGRREPMGGGALTHKARWCQVVTESWRQWVAPSCGEGFSHLPPSLARDGQRRNRHARVADSAAAVAAAQSGDQKTHCRCDATPITESRRRMIYACTKYPANQPSS